MGDDEELNELRQAALNSIKDNKSDNLTNVSSSSSSNARDGRVRSQGNSLQNNNGLMRIPLVHSAPLLPSPPVAVQQSKPCKNNIAPYNGDFVQSKSQSQVNNGQRYGGSPGSPIRHHSQPTQSTQQSSAVHSQQPHHSQQQSSSQPSQSSGRHHHIPPVHNQGFPPPGQNQYFRPNGGPPPQHGGHHGMNSMSPHMPGLPPVPYGHQGAPPPPPSHLGHPAYRGPYPQAPHHAPPHPSGLNHLHPPGSFHPHMHAPSTFHPPPPAGYTPLHYAKRPSGPRHGPSDFPYFYPQTFNVNSGPNHMHSSNDHSPPLPHPGPPHLLPHGSNGMHGGSSNVKMPLNDSIHRSNFNESRNLSHSGHRRKPYDAPGSNRGSSHNHNNNHSSDDQFMRNGSSSSNQPKNQRDGRNSPSLTDSSARSSTKADENDSNSPKHRGPERFSRIERSDSESDEDDRLDGLLDDLNDDGEGDSAEKSQDSLYNTNSGSFTNPLLDNENADDESDQLENEEEQQEQEHDEDEDNVCKLKKSDDHDEGIQHQAKKARLL